VDDQQENLNIRKVMLEKLGAEVLTAYDSQMGLRLISEGHVDLALLDYHLGIGSTDGELLAHDIRVIRPHLPLIMLSGDPSIPQSATNSVDVVIIKGVNGPVELLNAIESLVPNALPLRPRA
jgi:CheY-like chemotaxis protein